MTTRPTRWRCWAAVKAASPICSRIGWGRGTTSPGRSARWHRAVRSSTRPSPHGSPARGRRPTSTGNCWTSWRKVWGMRRWPRSSGPRLRPSTAWSRACSATLLPRARSTSSSDCTPRWSTARPQPEPCGPSFPPSSPTGWPRESPSRSRKSWRSRCSSPTSAASQPSPSSSPPARWPASWADTWRPWPTSSSSTGGPSTSSRATG